jgi:hypothetical protein
VFEFLIASAVGGSGRFTATVSIRERRVTGWRRRGLNVALFVRI